MGLRSSPIGSSLARYRSPCRRVTRAPAHGRGGAAAPPMPEAACAQTVLGLHKADAARPRYRLTEPACISPCASPHPFAAPAHRSEDATVESPVPTLFDIRRQGPSRQFRRRADAALGGGASHIVSGVRATCLYSFTISVSGKAAFRVACARRRGFRRSRAARSGAGSAARIGQRVPDAPMPRVTHTAKTVRRP